MTKKEDDRERSIRTEPRGPRPVTELSVDYEEEFNLDDGLDLDADVDFEPIMLDGVGGDIGDGNEADDEEDTPMTSMGQVGELASQTMSFLTKTSKNAVQLPTLTSSMAAMNPTSFGKPKSMTEAANRVRTNMVVYTRNYLCVGIVLFTLAIITTPTLLFPLLAVGVVWMIVLGQQEDPDKPAPMFGPIPLNKRTKCLMLTPVTLFLCMWMAGGTMVWVFIVTFILSTVHAAYHITPEHMKSKNGASILPLYDPDNLEAGLVEFVGEPDEL